LSVKTKFTATLVVAAVVIGLGYTQGWGLGRPVREDNEEQITLEVTFNPNRMEGIHIVATVEGVPIYDHPQMESPWIHAEWVPRGARVSLRAWQESYGDLTCKVHARGKVVAGPHSTNQTPGSVACVYRST
jgi:hypothetical protein